MLIIKVTTGFFFFSFRIFTATIEIVQKLRMEYMPQKKKFGKVYQQHDTKGCIQTLYKWFINLHEVILKYSTHFKICIPGLKRLTPHHIPSTTESTVDLKVCAL